MVPGGDRAGGVTGTRREADDLPPPQQYVPANPAAAYGHAAMSMR
jgi:hypothetical protein